MAPASAPLLQKAGEMSLKDSTVALRDEKAIHAARTARAASVFVEKHCKSDVTEEWKKADDKKIAKLRGVLRALQEENQETQLLKRQSEDAEALRDLQATRFCVEQRTTTCREKEEQFNKQHEELRKQIEKNQVTMRDLKASIEKSEQKSKDEQTHSRQLDREIEGLKEELTGYEAAKEMEARKIMQTARYRHYLEAVVKECEEEFEGDIETLMNRHRTLEAGNKELHETNVSLTSRLDKLREECNRVQTKLQTDHLMISSQLHESQVNLDKHCTESQELEGRLNRALEDKELKESQVGVVQMAVEQLFLRTVASCKLKQRAKAMRERVDVKFAPVRGDRGEARLEAMLALIVERIMELKSILADARQEEKNQGNVDLAPRFLEESDVLERVTFVNPGAEQTNPSSPKEGESSLSLAAGSSFKRGAVRADASAAATSGVVDSPAEL